MYIYLQKFIIIIRHISRYICSINRTFVASIKKFQTHRLDAQRAKLSATKLRGFCNTQTNDSN